MARSSSALLLTLLCVAALMCLSAARKERLLGRGGYNHRPGASVTDILASKEFQVAAGKAWKESFLGRGGYNLYQERGGWVYADSNNPKINLVVQLASSQRSAQATQSEYYSSFLFVYTQYNMMSVYTQYNVMFIYTYRKVQCIM